MNTQCTLPRRAWMGSVFGAGLAAAMGWPHATQAQASSPISGLNDAINQAGRQRMLSQRMAKAWMAIGQGIDARRAEKILAESVVLFERQLAALKAYAPQPDVRATYAELEAAWLAYKGLLHGGAPRREQAPALLAADARVLKLAQQGTAQLEALSGQALGRLVNLAGRERMLSQRSAKFYLSLSWGASGHDQTRELELARREFAQALSVLKAAPETTPSIREALELASQQWVFFDNALNRLGQTAHSAQHASEVFHSSENILLIMDRVTGLYARQA